MELFQESAISHRHGAKVCVIIRWELSIQADCWSVYPESKSHAAMLRDLLLAFLLALDAEESAIQILNEIE